MIARIQAQLRYSAQQNYEAIALPPFTCYFNPENPSPWNNYAIPDEPITAEQTVALHDQLAELCAHYQQQERQEMIYSADS